MVGLAPHVPVLLALDGPDVVWMVAILDGLRDLGEELALDEGEDVLLVRVDGNLSRDEKPVNGCAVPCMISLRL